MRFYRTVGFLGVYCFMLAWSSFGQGTHVFVAAPSGLPVPDYGASVKEYGLLGSVVVFFRIDETGKVVVSKMKGPLMPCSDLKSPLPGKIRKAVLDAVSTASLVPIMENGKPARSGSEIEFWFDPSTGKEGVVAGSTYPTFKTFGTMNHRANSLPNPAFPKVGFDASEVVAVSVLVSDTGNVVAALPTLGPAQLHDPALAAACKATFPPAVVSDRPVRSFGQIVYTLEP